MRIHTLPLLRGIAFLALFFSFFSSHGQQFSKATGGSTTNQVFGSVTALHSQQLYDAANLGLTASGKIDRIYFRHGDLTSNTLTNLVVRLGQTTSTSGFGGLTGTTNFYTGLTTVYSSAARTFSAGAVDDWFSIDISGYDYDISQRLIVDVTFTSSTNAGFAVTSSTTNSSPFVSKRKLFANNTTASTGTTSTSWPDFGIDMAPTNDDCSGALVLSPGINCMYRQTGSTFAASQSLPGITCTGNLAMNADDDVWYMFQASGQGDTISVNAVDAAFDAVVDVYNACVGGVRVACADANTVGGSEVIRMANLTAGEIYYVRVYSYDTFKGRFGICLRNKNNPCITPTPTIKANKTETVSNGSILLTLTSNQPGSMSLQWQQSTDHGNTWTDLNGHTAPLDTVIYQTLNTDTVYFRAATQLGNCLLSYSDPVKVFVRCAVPIGGQGNYINSVKLNEINNTSTYDSYGGNYQDFRNLTANLCAGETSVLTLVNPVALANNRLVWIDFNRDGDFSDVGEKVFAGSASAATSMNIPISIPASATSGKTTIRISLFWDNESQAGDGPCDNDSYFFGEIEEYSIQITQLVQADAGVTGLNCGSSAVLTANTITNGLGTWSIDFGSGIFADVNDPHTTITGLANGINVLRWTASSALCSGNSDTVVITVNQPVAANAGTDMVVCTTFVTVTGNSGPIGSTYGWTKISGVGTVIGTSGPSAFYSGIGSGTSFLQYALTVPGCPPSLDTMTVTNVNQSEPNAGPAQTVCGTTTNMQGSVPQFGSGKWTVISGTGIFADDTNPASTVTGLQAGANVFRWTYVNPPCPADFDQVTITSITPVKANAGTDQVVCTTFVSLNGNSGPSGTTYGWSKISGVGTLASFGGPAAFYSGVGVGISDLRFSLTVPGCPASFDTVRVTRRANPVADAGPDQVVCSTATNMAAVVPSEGQGTWKLVSGAGSISDIHSPSAQVTGLQAGTMSTFRWIVSNSPCPSDSDEVSIGVNQPVTPNAGSDRTVCSNTVTLTGTPKPAAFPIIINNGVSLIVIRPLVHWAQSVGTSTLSDPDSNVTTASAMSVGENRYVYGIFVPACGTLLDSVSIFRVAPPSNSNAGPDQVVCGSSATLAGNVPASGTGKWTVVSGAGTFANENSPASQVTGLQSGVNTFRWTISNSPCAARTNDVDITSNPPFNVNAGPDVAVCSTGVVLNADTAGANGGIWTLISGSGTISPFNSGKTAVINGLAPGLNVFEYFTNTICGDRKDTVRVTRFIAPVANAGGDQNVCSNSATLNASVPANGAGRWSRVSGSGTIANPTQRNSFVSGLGIGNNVFKWKVTNAPCPADSDNVTINYTPITPPDAGPDMAVCSTAVILTGSDRGSATATWSDVEDVATLTPFNNGQSAVANGLIVGTNTFVYALSSVACGTLTDTVVVTRVFPYTAEAGYYQQVCSDTTHLDGSTNASGRWTRISGSGVLVNPTDPNTLVTGLGMGENVFQWKITNEPCPSDSDQVTILRSEPVPVYAGKDTVLCRPTITLQADTAGDNGGFWTLLSGSGTITSSNNGKTASITGLGVGANVFVYQTAFFCGTSIDTVTVTRTANPTTANAGPPQTVCVNHATMAANTPLIGQGTWNVQIGSGTIVDIHDPNTEITGLSVGTNLFMWEIKNPPCFSSTQVVSVTYTLPDTVDIGPDIAVCSSAASLTASFAGINGGSWAILSGSGTISPFNNGQTAVINGLAPGANVVEYQTFTTCGVIKDTVVITRFVAPVANAGTNQTICSTSVSLNAVNPANGTGRWTRVSGSGTVQNPTNRNSPVTGLGLGINVFKWKVTNAPCPADSDLVTITRIAPITANAGPDQTITTNSATLAAGNPTGAWSVATGSGSVSEPNNPSSVVSGLSLGLNEFVWTVTNSPCPASTDTVRITVNEVASPCSLVTVTASATGNMDANVQVVFSGPISFQSYRVLFGDGVISPVATDPAGFAHTYSSAGIKNPCAEFLYLNALGSPVTCLVCDTVLIPEPVDPCDSLTIVAGTPTVSVITEPADVSGWYYEFPVTFTFPAGRFSKVGFTSSDELGSGTLVVSPLATTAELNFTMKPGSKNICFKAYFMNVQGALDSCVQCMDFNFPAPPACDFFRQKIRKESPWNFSVVVNYSNQSAVGPFVTDFGDGSTHTGFSNGDSTTHNYTAPGLYFICTKGYYNQGLDSCTVCDTVYIPNPCDSFDFNAVVTKSVVNHTDEPEEPGWYYDFVVDVHYPDAFFTATKFQFDNTALLLSENYGSGPKLFAYVQVPKESSPRRLCVYGYYQKGDGSTDSCTVCKTFNTPPPPVCDFFDIRTKTDCGKTAIVKVLYTRQAPVDGYKVSFGDGLVHHSGATSGDSIGHTYNLPGTYTICATGYYNQGLDSCEVCDTLTIPAGPNAGEDQTICRNFTSLSGNAVPSGYSASWAQISGTGTVNSPNSPNTSVSGLSPGVSEFVYTFFSQTCPSQSDTVRIVRDEAVSANAGPDQTICADSASLSATPVTVGSGQWTLVSGSATLAEPANPSTTITELGGGDNSFAWTVSNGVCPSVADTVHITVSPALTISAGFDQLSCNTSAALQGSVTTGNILPNATIQWSLLGGSGTIANAGSLSTTASDLGVGENVFGLTITQPGCASVSDTVIKMREPQTEQANAGQDQSGCSSAFTLNANLPNEHTGTWTVLTGAGTFGSSAAASTQVTGLAVGTNEFIWTLSTLCGSTSDTVSIIYQPLDAQAGVDKTICKDSTRLEANGVGTWKIISGTADIISPAEPNTLLLNLGAGANTFQWKVEGLGCLSDSDQVIITYVPPIQANAGQDDTVYVDSTTLVANGFGAGSAVWTKILGGAIIESPNSAVTDVMSLSPGLNRFVWTVTNQSCDDNEKASPIVTADTVTITFIVPIDADAGTDLTVCEDTLILSGNSAGQGTGQWTVIAGAATVDEPQNPVSVVHNLSQGDNVFEWVVTVPSLEPTKDTVVIHRYLPAVADAGPDQNLCNLQTVTLTAAPDPENRNGSWFLLSGCGIITNATSRTTTVTDICDGENVFQWKTFDPLCNEATAGPTDDVRIFITLPDEALAGNDQETCADSTQLEGTAPANGAGQWSVATGSGNFEDATLANSTVHGLAVGSNTFVWTVTTGNCPPEMDTVLIVRVAPLPVANAGPDNTVCGNTATLHGNSPQTGNGVWTQIAGTGQILVAEDSVTSVSLLSSGINQFVWTIFNGNCPQTSDTVTITVNPAPVAFAGIDAVVCSDTSHLSASPLSGGASGAWSVVSGSATIGSPILASTGISNLTIGQNQFVWTVSVTGCSPVSDTVTVFRTGLTVPTFAGNDTAICGTITNLNADAPIAGTGTWLVVTGTGQLLDANDPKTSVSNLQAGTNILVWSINNQPCPISTDTVVITVNQSFAANAGLSFFACADTGSLHAVPPPGTSTGLWTVETGTAIVSNPTSANTLVTNLSNGLNVFKWTVSVATCPDVSDTVAVVRLGNTLNLGNDTTICVGDSLELTVPPGFTGFTWSTGSVLPTIKLLAGDTVVLTVNTQQNCSFSDTIRVAFEICDAVNPMLTSGLNIGLQPNPASSKVMITIENPESKLLGIQMFNAVGAEVRPFQKLSLTPHHMVELDVNHIPNGVYTIRISDAKVHWMQKIVVQH